MTRQTIGKWRHRFLLDRLQGLHDEQRPGPPHKISDEQVERMIVKTLSSTKWRQLRRAGADGQSTRYGVLNSIGA